MAAQIQPSTSTAQPTSLQAEASQALAFLLKHEMTDPNAIVPGTAKPLPPHGIWSVGKQRPTSCPQTPNQNTSQPASPTANLPTPPASTPNNPTHGTPTTTAAPLQSAVPCVRILYYVPGTPVSAEWVVLLHPDGTGVILEQNSDSIRYMLRIVPTAEAAPMVVARQTDLNSRTSPRVSGVVEVGVIISTTGEPTRLFPVSGPETLRFAGLAIAKQWIFRPLTINGRPIPYETVIKFTFGNGKIKTEP